MITAPRWPYSMTLRADRRRRCSLYHPAEKPRASATVTFANGNQIVVCADCVRVLA